MSWLKFQQSQVIENRFTNFQPITPSKYADNLCLSVEEYNRLSKSAPHHEKQLKTFNERCVNSFTKKPFEVARSRS